jgi:glycosyltransferase involved in cell wall biosynthesis
MRVVYYSRPCFLDHVLPQAKAISQLAELHLFLELSPEFWNSSLFDVAPKALPSGIISADPVLKDCFPPGVRQYWQDCAGFHLVVHNSRRTIHPGTWMVSHKAVQFIRSLKPDVVHMDDVSVRLASSSWEFKNIPVVLTIHDPELHSGELNWRIGISRWLTFRQTDRFLLHSEGLRGLLASRYGISDRRIDVVPLGVLDIFREWIDTPVKPNNHTVLFIGRLSPYKGLEVLYDTAPLVAEKVPNVRFVVAGQTFPGYQLPETPLLPENSSFEVINEYLSNRRLTEIIQEASVVVCPYIDATQSGVVLVAYAFDKPVVATNTGGLPEYVKQDQTGLLVPPKDAGALSDALIKILTDAELMRNLTDGVKKIKEGVLSWKSIGERTLDIYKRTLQD